MKTLLLYSFIILAVISGCRKSDNEKLPQLTEVPEPLLKKDASTDLTITAQTPELFNATFSVGVLFPGVLDPAKMDVVIRRIGMNTAIQKVDTLYKTFKADVTTYPTNVNVTGPQLKALFNRDILLGDKFDIGADITTTTGKKYFAFPAVGVAYGTGVASSAGASTLIRYEAICKYIPSQYAGNFKVTVDGWADFGVGTIVPVTVVNDHQLSFKSPISGAPIIVDVNVITNETSIAKQPYGDYKAAGIDPTWPYGMASAETINSLNNYVAPCDLVLSLQIKYTVSAGGFGDFTLTMKKQ